MLISQSQHLDVARQLNSYLIRAHSHLASGNALSTSVGGAKMLVPWCRREYAGASFNELTPMDVTKPEQHSETPWVSDQWFSTSIFHCYSACHH